MKIFPALCFELDDECRGGLEFRVYPFTGIYLPLHAAPHVRGGTPNGSEILVSPFVCFCRNS